MRAMPPALVGFPGRVRGLFHTHRANLRSRTYATAAFNPPTAPHEVVPVVTRDGARLRVHVYGPADAQTIVLVHGWTCAIEYWNAQINEFADQYRVVVYDVRGHGESELGSSRLTTDLLADDLAAVLDATLCPGERAVMVGHSLGGMTLQAWAGRYPERVVKQACAVLLTNTAPGRLIAETTVLPIFNAPLPLLNRRIALPPAIGRFGLGAAIVFPPIAPVKWAFTRQIMSLRSTGDVVDYSLAVVRSCPARVRAKFGILLAELDLGESARNLVVPTTILAGEFDDMTPPVHAERIAEMLRETGSLVKYEVLPQGHLGNTEMYERFNEELALILDSVRQPAKAAG
ncbi:alpha/beta fold hydrolase [Nocardia anaemiae]|uniref:alpha/beta fold hydrolase n=1 Tax=Nocardia anaemiae TaxID=263910 RepID=UPI0007A3F5A9|nr:alpha/beta hydrolase [Nocardia anaemiae]